MNPSEEIVAAVKARDAAKVKSLLESDPRLAHTKVDGESILLTATWYGAKECVELLRAHKPALDLDEAIAQNEISRVQDIVRQRPGASNEHFEDGGTPLQLAAYLNRRDIAEFLLNHGAVLDTLSLNARPNIPRNTALHAAIAGQAWETANLLVERGASVNICDSIGGIPLHNAAARNHPDMIRTLLAKGADINLRNNAGLTPLGLALSKGYTEAAAVLREHGGAE